MTRGEVLLENILIGISAAVLVGINIAMPAPAKRGIRTIVSSVAAAMLAEGFVAKMDLIIFLLRQ